MKRKLYSLVCIGAVLLLGLGCSTTPSSIQSLGSTEVQMLRALETDTVNIVASYDYEVRHWADLAFRQAMQNAEVQLVAEDGTVNLKEYKAKVSEVAAQMGSTIAQYDKNKADILAAMSEKFDKALLMMTLINEYENSTGASPETWAALTSELGGLAVEMNDVYEGLQAQRDAERAAAEPSFRDRLNLAGNGMFDLIYDRVMGSLSSGEPLIRVPEVPVIPDVPVENN